MRTERRNIPRVGLVRLAFVKAGAKAHGGLTRDISETGAYVEFRMPLGQVTHDFTPGSTVELHLDNGVTLVGKARRIEPEGMAIGFDDAKQRATLNSLIAEGKMLRRFSHATVHHLRLVCE